VKCTETTFVIKLIFVVYFLVIWKKYEESDNCDTNDMFFFYIVHTVHMPTKLTLLMADPKIYFVSVSKKKSYLNYGWFFGSSLRY